MLTAQSPLDDVSYRELMLPREVPASEHEPMNGLFAPMYPELLRLAASKVRQYRPDPHLDATSVLHESYLRLTHMSGDAQFSEPGYFLAYASRVIRSVIVDFVRSARSERRGGDCDHVSIEAIDETFDCSAGYVELQDALSQLEVVSPRVARVVEARFFVGLSEQETATQMGVTTRTVQRDLEKAKKLLTGLLHS